MQRAELYASIEPLHVAAKLLGFLAFSIDPKTFEPVFEPFDLVCLALSVVTNSLMNFIYWTTIFDFVFDRSTIMNIGIPYITLAQNIIVVVIVVASFARACHVCDILRKLAEVDEELAKNFRVRFDYARHRRQVLRLTITMLVLVSVIVVVRYSSNLVYMASSSVKTNVYCFWCFCGNTLVLMSFKLAALGVKMRFEALNRCLSLDTIKKLSKIHLKITDTVQLINRTFSLALMLYFVIFFCWFCVYCFLVVSTSKEVWLNYSGYILLRLSANIFIDGLMFSAIRTASVAEIEGQKTARILIEMRIDESGAKDEIFVMMSAFIEQVQLTSTKFSCGLFSYDWKFLFKFLSAVIMYVIFMVQFDSSLNGDTTRMSALREICTRNSSELD